MGIRHDLAIFGQERTIQYARRRNKYLIGGIPMEWQRQLGGLHGSLRGQRNKGDTGQRHRRVNPISHCAIQRQPAIFYDLGSFPARNDANAE